MQIVIDIPKEYYDEILTQGMDGSHLMPLYKALVNGTPLDKIRAEIRKKMRFDSFNEGIVSFDDISKIFDKYKTESEKI